MSHVDAAFVWILIIFNIFLIAFIGKGGCCGIPKGPDDGTFSPLMSTYRDNDKVTYSCNPGFRMDGSVYNYCRNQKWTSPSPPNCIPTCGTPGYPENGYLDNENEPIKDVTTYACLRGFTLVGASTRTCSRNGTWTPVPMPKCVPNLAYNKNVTQMGSLNNLKPMVDGNFGTCYGVVNVAAFDFGINFGQPVQLTNISMLLQKGNKISINLTVSNDTLPNHRQAICSLNIPFATSPLSCNTNNNKPIKAKYVHIEPIDGQKNNFSICEVQVFNSNLEQTNCGKPDAPLNGSYVKVTYPDGLHRYQYRCNNGYTISGREEIQCFVGQWNAPAPKCIALSPTSKPITTKPTPITTKPTPKTPSTTDSTSTTSKERDDNGAAVVGIMGIAIGATAASVAIVVAILVVVCIMKKYYKKKSRLPSCNDEYGPRCGSRLDSHSAVYNRSQDGSQGSYVEAPPHVYDTIHDYRFPLQTRQTHNYDQPETVFNSSYGIRPPLPAPGTKQLYEQMNLMRRDSHEYDEVNEDNARAMAGTARSNDPDIMKSTRVDSLYVPGAPRTTL